MIKIKECRPGQIIDCNDVHNITVTPVEIDVLDVLRVANGLQEYYQKYVYIPLEDEQVISIPLI